jgi:hypothetical protein
VVKAAVAQSEFRADVSPSLFRDMIYGFVEHRTCAFLRTEGDFEMDKTAGRIADIIYRGLIVGKSATRRFRGRCPASRRSPRGLSASRRRTPIKAGSLRDFRPRCVRYTRSFRNPGDHPS